MHVSGIFPREAKRLINSQESKSEAFLDFVNDILLNSNDGRSAICMEFINLAAKQAAENNNRSIFTHRVYTILINSLSRSFESESMYCIFAGRCVEVLLLFTASDSVPSLTKSISIQTLFSILERMINASSSKTGLFERYNYFSEFNVLRVLRVLSLYFNLEHVTKKNAILYAMTITTHNSLLQKVGWMTEISCSFLSAITQRFRSL